MAATDNTQIIENKSDSSGKKKKKKEYLMVAL